MNVDRFEAVEGKGVRGEINGQMAFVGNNKLLENVRLTSELSRQFDKLQQQAKTVVVVGQADQVIGLIAIQDTPKKTSQAAVTALKARGLKTVMLTGDNKQVAQSIANEVGIDQVIANVLPKDKANQVKALQAGGKVAFVGDGLMMRPH